MGGWVLVLVGVRLPPRLIPVFEETGHIWNLPNLQKAFAMFSGEPWCAVIAMFILGECT